MRAGMCKCMKQGRKDNSLIGAAGVHYAAYKLIRRGMLALPTIRNTPGTDLIVTSRDGRNYANIQVKTSQYPRAKFWIICSAKKFDELPFGEHDFYVLLRPHRSDDPIREETCEFEGFMLTAQEAKREMQAHLDFKTRVQKEIKFSLCIWVDKGRREQSWPENINGEWKKHKEEWRKRWLTWEM
jgi:hypothetical protein